MILTLITIGAIILGVILLTVAIKIDFSGSEIIFGAGMLVVIAGGTMGLTFGYTMICNQLPSTQSSLQFEYEETYNILTTSLKTDKNNVIILADKVAEYNTKVKKHYARLEDPWVNWLEPNINIELQTINLEDYLN